MSRSRSLEHRQLGETTTTPISCVERVPGAAHSTQGRRGTYAETRARRPQGDCARYPGGLLDQHQVGVAVDVEISDDRNPTGAARKVDGHRRGRPELGVAAGVAFVERVIHLEGCEV